LWIIVERLPAPCTYSAKEPHISAKEPYFAAKEPYIAAKELCIAAKEPYISAKKPNVQPAAGNALKSPLNPKRNEKCSDSAILRIDHCVLQNIRVFEKVLNEDRYVGTLPALLVAGSVLQCVAACCSVL